MLDVEGIYRGRPYLARLTADGIWVVRSAGPVFVFPALASEQAGAVRLPVERLFDALPEAASCIAAPQRADTSCIETWQDRAENRKARSLPGDPPASPAPLASGGFHVGHIRSPHHSLSARHGPGRGL